MGQMTLGLLYGVEAPDLPSTEAYEEPLYDLLVRFHTAAGIDMFPSWRDENAPLRVEQNHEGDKSLVGVWVAVGGSGEPGVPFFLDAALPLESLAEFYAEAHTKAHTLWTAFASYCAEHEHILLGNPMLWITPTEVA